MKNKYFDELQEMGFMEDQDFSEDPDFEPLPDSADDPGQVTRTFRKVLLGIGILTAAEELLIFFLIGGIFPSRSILKWSCMAGVFAGSLIGVLIFWLMKLQIARIAEGDPENKVLQWKLRLGAVGRILLVAGAAVGALFIPAVNPIALIAGVLNLKISVLLFPVLDKAGKKV